MEDTIEKARKVIRIGEERRKYTYATGGVRMCQGSTHMVRKKTNRGDPQMLGEYGKKLKHLE